MDQGMLALVIFVGLVAVWLIFYFIPVGLWFSALVSGVKNQFVAVDFDALA